MAKITILLGAIMLSYLAGYNKGFNNGWEKALKFDPMCQCMRAN